MSVTVYSKPRCVQCDATKRALRKQGVDFIEIDMSVDMDALAKVREMGFQQAPVVVTADDAWAGFRPDKIKGIAMVQAQAVNA